MFSNTEIFSSTPNMLKYKYKNARIIWMIHIDYTRGFYFLDVKVSNQYFSSDHQRVSIVSTYVVYHTC